PSGNDLILSFTAASPRVYTVQSSIDLLQWTNLQTSIPGDGTVKSVTESNALSGSQGFYRFAAQLPMSLTLPQSTAFSILGYSCGGIQEQVTAGFDVSNGYPTGLGPVNTNATPPR